VFKLNDFMKIRTRSSIFVYPYSLYLNKFLQKTLSIS